MVDNAFAHRKQKGYVSRMPDIRRLTIANKLLAWSCALIFVFFAMTAYLFQQVRQDATVASRIVDVNHDADSAIQRMLERLYSVQDNIRRYRLIGNDEAVTFIVEDLTRFGEILEATLKKHPRYTVEWQELNEEYEITLDPSQSPKDNLAPDETILEWTDILEQSLLDNQSDMELSLTRLHEAGQQAADIGLYGLALCLAIGIGGSLSLAYFLNRSLTEIQGGIRELGTGGPPRDVRVLSGDELGELALAFNAMAARLRREEAMRADFIGMLSHEIRTPLTSIREAVDLVGTGTFGEVNERQQQFLSIAEKETVRLSDLLSRLMSVSRMESETLEIVAEPVDCLQLLNSAAERLKPAAKAKNITLSMDTTVAPMTCFCDPDHIQQVLLNLMGNGIKFSPDGSTMTVGVASNNEQVTFRIHDTGPGIPMQEQKRIFQKYYREPGVRDSVDGAGLGLTIAKRIVDAHNGRIWLESTPGHGSTFCFSLPVHTKESS